MSKPSSTNSPGLSYHKNGWYICRASKGVSSKRVIVTRQIRGVVQSNILRCKKQEIKVVIALGIHLFPFRTEKLSPTTSMVLRKSGRVDSRRFRGKLCKEEGLAARLAPFSILQAAPFLWDYPFCRILVPHFPHVPPYTLLRWWKIGLKQCNIAVCAFKSSCRPVEWHAESRQVKMCWCLLGCRLCGWGVASGLLVLYSADHAERAEAVREGIKKVSTGFFETWAVLPRKTEVFWEGFLSGIGVVSKFIYGAHATF